MSENGSSRSETPEGSSSGSSARSSPPPGTPPNLHQNSLDPESKWIVQKFGGTSVGKFVAKIAEEIVPLVFNFTFIRKKTDSKRFIDNI